MADVVLIFPAFSMINSVKAIEQDVDSQFLNDRLYPPLGLSYLASSLEKNDISVKILDIPALALSQHDVISILKNESPLVVGLYVTSFSLHFTATLIQRIKESLSTLIIVGGPHITYAPKSTFKLGADYGMVGEGEYSLPQFVKQVKNNKSVDDVPGLIMRNGAFIKVNKPEVIENLNALPFPARHLLPNKRYFSPLCPSKMTTMITSRGCVYDCIFCSLPQKKFYRIRNAKNILEELELLSEEGYRYIEIQDDFFTFNRETVEEICEGLITNGHRLKWGCETRADFVDYQLLSLMQRAGCTNVKYGIECKSERVRNKVIGKHISNVQIKEAVKNTKRTGMEVVGYMMLGNPTETIVEIEETIRYAQELDLDYVGFHLVTPIPGSRLFHLALQEGKLEKNVWGKTMDGGPIPVYLPEGITLKEIQKLQKKAMTDFYFRPDYLFRQLFKISGIRDLALRGKTAISLRRGYNPR